MGAEPTESPLTMVSGVELWNDHFILLEMMAGRVLRISKDDGAATLVGAVGPGPGEYLQPQAAGVQDGALWIYDLGNRRLSWLNEAWEVDREVPLHHLPDSLLGRYGPPAEPLANGSHLLRPSGSPWLQTDGTLPRMPIYRAWEDGTIEGVLVVMPEARPPTARIDHSRGPNAGTAFVRQPFSDAPLLRVSGDTVAWFPLGFTARPLHRAHADSVILARYPVGMGLDIPAVGHLDFYRSHLYIPEFLPPVEMAMISRDRGLWVGGWATSHNREWRAFDLDGAQRGRVHLPADFRLLGAEGELVCGVREGEFGETVFVAAQVTLEP